MSATLVREMSAAPVPEWFYPPEGRAWTVDDLDNLPPDAPRRLEIIDGALVVMSPQSAFHTLALDVITFGLREQAPDQLIVIREWTVALPNGDGPEPDVLVADRSAIENLDQTRVAAEHVHLAVEVVSPDSRKRDLVRKPQLYAEAGIEHYWTVDREVNTTVVLTYQLDPTVGYRLTGEHSDHVSCTTPFPVELDLSTKALGFRPSS